MTFSLDYPWSANFMVETQFVRSLSGFSLVIGVLITLVFWIVAIAAMLALASTSQSPLSSSTPDITSFTAVELLVCSACWALLGFLFGLCDHWL